MPYNLPLTVFTQSVILDENRPFCVFEPPFGGLWATCDDHLRFIGKRVVDFLLVLIELFSLGVTAEALDERISVEIGDFAPTGAS